MEIQEERGAAAELKGKCSFRFERKDHLKRRKDIQAVFNRGTNCGCHGAKLFVLPNNLTHNRICFTFSRGFGNAVKRNRARRLGREAYRFLRPRLRGGYDLILMVFPETKKPAVAPDLAARKKQLEFLFSKAGLL